MQILLILLFFGLAFIAQYFYRTGTHIVPANVLLILAFAAMAWVTRKADVPPEPPEAPSPPPPSKTRRITGLVLLALGLITCAVASYTLTTAWNKQLMRWAPVFFAGLVAACLGADLAQGYLRRRSTARNKRKFQRRRTVEVAVLLVILAAAVFLRAYRLDWYPPPDGRVTTEEMQHGNWSSMVITKNYRHWEWIQTIYPGALTFYFLGPSLMNSRIHGVIFGILTMIPFYLLLRRLSDVRASLFATALFAICVWHFTCSRYNDAVYHGIVFVTICWALLVYSSRSNRLSLILWLGFFSAMEFYDYDAFKATPLLVIIFFIARWSSKRFSSRRLQKAGKIKSALTSLRGSWKKPVLLLLMMALVSAPFISHVRKAPQRLLSGINRATGHGWGWKSTAPRGPGDRLGKAYYDTSDLNKFLEKRGARLKNIAKLLYRRTRSPMNYCTVAMGGDPLFDPITRVFLLLALAYALLHPLRRHNWFFLMLFFMVIAGNMVTNNLDIRRMACITPYVYILIGLFVAKVFSCIDEAYPKRKLSRVFFALLMGCALATGIANYRYAFGKVYVYFGTNFFRNEYTVLIKFVNKLNEEDRPIIITQYPLNFFRHNDYYWLLRKGKNGIVSGDVVSVPELLQSVPQSSDAVLVFQKPYDVELLAEWMGYLCPTLTFDRFTDENDPKWPSGLFCRITPEQLKDIIAKSPDTGLRAQYTFSDEVPEIYIERTEPFISLATIPDAFRPEATKKHSLLSKAKGYRASWTGTIGIPQSGKYSFSFNSQNGKGQLFIDNKKVDPDHGVELSEGSHIIRLEAEFKKLRNSGIKFLWKTPEQKSWAPVPLWKLASPEK